VNSFEVVTYSGGGRGYADPIAVLEAHALDEVRTVLARADEALEAGYSVAGYLTYEAGLAFEPPARSDGYGCAQPPAWLPLVALGIFDGYGKPPNETRETHARLGPLVAQTSQDAYEEALRTIARGIREGDVYQVNHTVPFAFAYDGDPWALFCALRGRAAVAHAAFVRHGERAFASLSPELFLAFDGERVRTKPMKGTGTDERDLGSEKNRAEHVMIVDLLRNDLHKICRSVAVRALFEREHYPTFTAMTSTIEGNLGRPAHLAEVFASTFPGGSITGAPKRSAMGFVAACERAPRGIAMGTIGYCDPQRRGAWNVAIRTLSLDTASGRGEVRVGGGIVADSDAGSEWAEILVKRRVFDAQAERVSLIETMRLEAGGTIVRRLRHLARLEASAFALGLPFDAALAEARLNAVAARTRKTGALLRLTLDPRGAIELVERELPALAAPARICIAPQRIRSSDPAVRFKTSRRATYEAALSFARAAGCAEALLLNERGSLADGTRTTVFVQLAGVYDGPLATPPLADGALAGVLRAELLESGRAVERSLVPADLDGAAILLGNSARGLTATEFAAFVPSG